MTQPIQLSSSIHVLAEACQIHTAESHYTPSFLNAPRPPAISILPEITPRVTPAESSIRGEAQLSDSVSRTARLSRERLPIPSPTPQSWIALKRFFTGQTQASTYDQLYQKIEACKNCGTLTQLEKLKLIEMVIYREGLSPEGLVQFSQYLPPQETALLGIIAHLSRQVHISQITPAMRNDIEHCYAQLLTKMG